MFQLEGEENFFHSAVMNNGKMLLVAVDHIEWDKWCVKFWGFIHAAALAAAGDVVFVCVRNNKSQEMRWTRIYSLFLIFIFFTSVNIVTFVVQGDQDI